MSKELESARGKKLLWDGDKGLHSVVTVEDYLKWYSLHLVHSDGQVEEINFGELEKYFDIVGQSAYCDHVPNPMAVCSYTAAKGYVICSSALAAITRRWYNEYHDPQTSIEVMRMLKSPQGIVISL